MRSDHALEGGIKTIHLQDWQISELIKKGRLEIPEVLNEPPPPCNHDFIGLDDVPTKFWELPPKKGFGFCCKVCGNGLVDRDASLLQGVRHPWASAKRPTVLVAADSAGYRSVRCFVYRVRICIEGGLYVWRIVLKVF